MILVNGYEVKFAQFPNGESRLVSNLSNRREVGSIISKDSLISIYGNEVTFKYEDDGDIARLIMVAEHVKQVKAPNSLVITHMPYARMDRVPNGEPMFLRTVASIINSLEFDSVKILEPHSDVTSALIKNSVTYEVTKALFHKFREEIGFRNDIDYLVFPDTTADRRYWDIDSNIENRIVFNKHRDFKTGKIVELTTNFKGYFNNPRTAVILDDMSSYGGTFIGVAEKLKSFGFERIILIVAHAENSIFSGEIFKTDLINMVYTTDSVMTQQSSPHNALIMNSGKINISTYKYFINATY